MTTDLRRTKVRFVPGLEELEHVSLQSTTAMGVLHHGSAVPASFAEAGRISSRAVAVNHYVLTVVNMTKEKVDVGHNGRDTLVLKPACSHTFKFDWTGQGVTIDAHGETSRFSTSRGTGSPLVATYSVDPFNGGKALHIDRTG